MKKLFIIILVNILMADFATSQIISGTYAIQNTVTNKNLRPYDAGNQNGNRIVSYNHEVWKCMTWEFKHISDSTYQLKNLFTSKSFQGKENPAKQGTKLVQQPLSTSPTQNWTFVRIAKNTYNICLKGTGLYITASSSDTNSDIILQEKQKNAFQSWRLVAQNPDM
jgi:hypothetical protein